MSNESPFTNATSSHSDADFWRTLASEFKVVAEKYDCQNAVLQFLYRDGDQPETWIVLDASKQGVIALTRLAILAFRKLGGTAQDSPWDAWARHLVNNDERHPFGWGPWNSKGQLDLENGTVDFEGYLRRQRFALIEESIEFCSNRFREVSLLLDEKSGLGLAGDVASSSPPDRQPPSTRAKRGRPQTIPNTRKEEVQAVKDSGGTNPKLHPVRDDFLRGYLLTRSRNSIGESSEIGNASLQRWHEGKSKLSPEKRGKLAIHLGVDPGTIPNE